jgi:AcrR family transcriptional regulator
MGMGSSSSGAKTELAAGARKASAAGAPSSRQTQKEATRARVMEAARELFDTQGYQGTTIREIARHAGVSVGSVFTTFASKYEVLSQVMQDRLDSLYAELDRVIPHLRGGTADRLRTMFAIHFAFEVRHKRLFLAYIAAAFDWTLPPTSVPMGRNQRLQAIIGDCLAAGVEQGDVDAGVDHQEVIDLLMAAYIWAYRLAAWHDADAAEMTAVMDRQIGLICEGFRPRGGPFPRRFAAEADI